MAVTSGFFNSVNHDRLYDAEQLSSIFDGIIIDGVYENYGEALNVTAVSTADNMVTVGTGRAWFDHTWTLNDTPLTLEIEPASEMVVRIDAVVLDIDRRKDVRKNSIIYVKGTVAEGEPPKPTLIDEELHKQYPLCYINRQPGTTGPVNQSEIEILVGTDKCPIVTGILDAQNLSNLFQQLEAEFNTWWDGIRDLIGDEDPVLNLQTQIDELKAYVEGKFEGDNALQGLLEKAVADLYITGDYKLNASSFNLPALTSGPLDAKFNSFLPDGKILVAGGINGRNSNTTVGTSNGTFHVGIVNTDGVLSNQKTQNWSGIAPGNNGMPTNYKGYQGWYSRYIHVGMVLDGSFNKLDKYPVSMNFAVVEDSVKQHLYQSSPDRYYNYPQYGVGMQTVTISSDGIISLTKTDLIQSGYSKSNFGLDNPDLRIYTAEKSCTPQKSGAFIFTGMTYSSTQTVSLTTNPCDFVAKVNSDGVLSAKFHMDGDSRLPAYFTKLRGGEGKAYYFYGSGTSVNSVTEYTDRYCEIDESTLDGTIRNESTSGLPYHNVTPQYEVSSYLLSEKNGVTIVKKGPGISGTESSFYRRYFTGASNSGDGLPEGTYIALENTDNGMLVGLGPNNTQIAIGTNGGAAILKTPATSGPGTINLDQIDTRFRGSVNTNNLVGYKTGTFDADFKSSVKATYLKRG